MAMMQHGRAAQEACLYFAVEAVDAIVFTYNPRVFVAPHSSSKRSPWCHNSTTTAWSIKHVPSPTERLVQLRLVTFTRCDRCSRWMGGWLSERGHLLACYQLQFLCFVRLGRSQPAMQFCLSRTILYVGMNDQALAVCVREHFMND